MLATLIKQTYCKKSSHIFIELSSLIYLKIIRKRKKFGIGYHLSLDREEQL